MTRIQSSLLSFLIAVPAAFAGGRDLAPMVPAYDLKTEVQFTAVVNDMRVVPDGPLAGMYLSVKTAKNESLDVYLGPVEFVKLFDITFKPGHSLQVIGSKVKFEEKDLVLGREVTVGKTTMVLRDQTGAPNWLWITKGFPSGL